MRNQQQINESLHQSLAEIFSTGIEIPKDMFITIRKVQVTSDLSTAKIFISVLPFIKLEEGIAFLVKNKGLIRKFLGSKIKNWRAMPDLRFVPDVTEEEVSQVHNLIEKL
jgi:ribosome-binding factor A